MNHTQTYRYPFPWNMIVQRIFRNSIRIKAIFFPTVKKKINKTLTINFIKITTPVTSPQSNFEKPEHTQVHLSIYTMEETRNAKYESDSQWNFQLKMYIRK